jgi:hypothetical protein
MNHNSPKKCRLWQQNPVACRLNEETNHENPKDTESPKEKAAGDG